MLWKCSLRSRILNHLLCLLWRSKNISFILKTQIHNLGGRPPPPWLKVSLSYEPAPNQKALLSVTSLMKPIDVHSFSTHTAHSFLTWQWYSVDHAFSNHTPDFSLIEIPTSINVKVWAGSYLLLNHCLTHRGGISGNAYLPHYLLVR